MRLQATLPVLPAKQFLPRDLQTGSLPVQELRRTSRERGASPLRGKPLPGRRRGALQRHVLPSQNHRRPMRAHGGVKRKRDHFSIGMRAGERRALRDHHNRPRKDVPTGQSQERAWNVQQSIIIIRITNKIPDPVSPPLPLLIYKESSR